MGLCGGFSAEVRAKKMRQDGSAEFISASLNPLTELALPISEVGLVQREVDGLPVVVIEAQANAHCLADGGQAGTREHEEHLVLVLVMAVRALHGMRRILCRRLHLPRRSVGVEDDVGQKFCAVIAIVEQTQRRALEPPLFGIGGAKINGRVRRETARAAMIDAIRVRESENADENEEQSDDDDQLAEDAEHRNAPFMIEMIIA